MSFEPTKEQRKAFKKVADAIKLAQKAGLVFYGKSDSLVAYTVEANDYIENYGFERCLNNGNKQIEHISQTGLINDSGADDYPCYYD